nr:DUF4878 domain-containing protein [Prevotella sp.]
MKKLLFVSLFIGMLFSCNKQEDPALIAATTAKNYYDLLIGGKYKEYVEGLYTPDSIPDGYREQLETNAKMYIGQLKEEHKGLQSVRIEDAKADTVHHAANVFLVLSYKDKYNEEVVVPMVQVKGKWKMR